MNIRHLTDIQTGIAITYLSLTTYSRVCSIEKHCTLMCTRDEQRNGHMRLTPGSDYVSLCKHKTVTRIRYLHVIIPVREALLLQSSLRWCRRYSLDRFSFHHYHKRSIRPIHQEYSICLSRCCLLQRFDSHDLAHSERHSFSTLLFALTVTTNVHASNDQHGLEKVQVRKVCFSTPLDGYMLTVF